jgi:hypothetical protein
MEVERKLTAILCPDVHAYSRLMAEDEEATITRLTRKSLENMLAMLPD